MSANAFDERLMSRVDQEARIAELEARLQEAEETLQAIRTGQVDALVVAGPEGEQIFTLEGADHAYRVLVEQMQEGAVTLDLDGLILYSNRRFASMMRTAVDKLVGSHIQRFVSADHLPLFSALLAHSDHHHKRSDVTLLSEDGTPVPVYVSVNRLDTGGMPTACVVVTDLTDQRQYDSMVKDEQLSRLILDQAAEAIVVIDARGIILRASESAMQLAGRNIMLQRFDTAFHLLGSSGRRARVGSIRSGSIRVAVPGAPV